MLIYPTELPHLLREATRINVHSDTLPKIDFPAPGHTHEPDRGWHVPTSAGVPLDHGQFGFHGRACRVRF